MSGRASNEKADKLLPTAMRPVLEDHPRVRKDLQERQGFLVAIPATNRRASNLPVLVSRLGDRAIHRSRPIAGDSGGPLASAVIGGALLLGDIDEFAAMAPFSIRRLPHPPTLPRSAARCPRCGSSPSAPCGRRPPSPIPARRRGCPRPPGSVRGGRPAACRRRDSL